MYECKKVEFFHNWIDRVRKKEINNELLLIIFDTKIPLRTIKNKIAKESNCLNCQILLSDNMTNTNLKQNTIIIGHIDMDMSWIENIKYKILYCNCRLFRVEENILERRDNVIYRNYTFESDWLYVLNKINMINPIDAIKHYNKYKISCNVLLKMSFLYKLKPMSSFLETDFKIFKQEGILTARLANIIYRISTLNFKISDTKIGLFYKKQFGVASKSMRLKKYNNKVYKVYDINKWLENENT